MSYHHFENPTDAAAVAVHEAAHAVCAVNRAVPIAAVRLWTGEGVKAKLAFGPGDDRADPSTPRGLRNLLQIYAAGPAAEVIECGKAIDDTYRHELMPPLSVANRRQWKIRPGVAPSDLENYCILSRIFRPQFSEAPAEKIVEDFHRTREALGDELRENWNAIGNVALVLMSFGSADARFVRQCVEMFSG